MSNIRTKNGLTGLFAIILLLVSTSSVLAPALMLSSSHSGSARANSTIGNTAVSNRAVVFSPPLFASMTDEGAPYAGPNSVAALQSPLSADFIFPTTNQNIGPVNPTTGSPSHSTQQYQEDHRPMRSTGTSQTAASEREDRKS